MAKINKPKTKRIEKPAHKQLGGKKKNGKIRPKTMQEFRESFKTLQSTIKNKQKRQQVHYKRNAIKNQIKMKQRKERQKLPAEERQVPITIQDKQQGGDEYAEQYNQKMFDQFNKILQNNAPVKILITTQLKPPTKSYDFMRELMMVFHNIAYYPRRSMKLEEIYKYAKDLEFTHVMVLRWSHGWELLVRHLQGMLAVFKITSVQYQKDIQHYGLASQHIPQLILNNFDSKVGVRIGRLLASLFPQNPQFKGRRVVTFHNQRDFIFFRHHRYIFKEGYDGVNMQEIGPRFTMRVKKVYSGEENKVGGLEFQARDNMYVDRKAVYL